MLIPFVFCKTIILHILAFFNEGLGWSYPCDIWSVGCILVELCSVCLICYFCLFVDDILAFFLIKTMITVFLG